jgi:hypothetical protein
MENLTEIGAYLIVVIPTLIILAIGYNVILPEWFTYK